MTTPYSPITKQPAGAFDGWMPAVGGGLDYLSTIDQLFIKQEVTMLEVMTGFEKNNKFTIMNAMGQNVYWAAEENDCCTRCWYGSARPMQIKVMDVNGDQIIHINRPFNCCLQQMEISSPPGSVIGTIQENWSFKPNFTIKNAEGEAVLKIEGPFWTCSCGGNVEFKLMRLNGRQVGKISKQWSGFKREFFTDADFFGISFPVDLDVNMKAVMLGACFLIDAMYFEK